MKNPYEMRERNAAQGYEFTRYYPIEDLRELPAAGEGIGRIGGYAAVFGVRSQPLFDLFEEVIRKGAFANSIRRDDVISFWVHTDFAILGRQSNGSLVLEEDDRGLKFELELPDTTWGRDAQVLIKRRDVKQMSFGFKVISEQWTDRSQNGGKYDLRELVEVQLGEISPVPFPAYLATEVEARSVWERHRTSPAADAAPPSKGDGEARGAATAIAMDAAGDDVAGAGEPAWRLGIAKRKLQLVEN